MENLTNNHKSGAFVVSGLGNRQFENPLKLKTKNAACKIQDRPSAEFNMVLTTEAPDNKLYETRKVKT